MTEGRKLTNWIDEFVAYTNGLKTPLIFRRWAAICAIAGAMERKVWTATDQGVIYPNLYVVLVGPPGTGKGESLKTLQRLWLETDEIFVASDTVSSASLIDELKEAHRKIFRPADPSPLTEFHSIQVMSTELSVFLPAYDVTLMSNLQKWYDCEPIFTESRRGRKKGEELRKGIKNPQVSMIAGTTPDFLGKMLPEGAWNQGFCARAIMVYSDVDVKIKFWGGKASKTALYQNLKDDLNIISKAFGRVDWSVEAAGALQNWVSDDCPPVPKHPKLRHYNTRRPVQMLKLCTIMCMSRADNEMVITMEDFELARRTLLDTERAMAGIFQEMVSTESSSSMEEVLHFIREQTAGGKPLPMSKVIHYISRFTPTPAHSVLRVYENMLKSGMIRVHAIGDRGNDLILPT